MSDDWTSRKSDAIGPREVRPATRASDDDRKRTADWLSWAAGSGQLSFDELDDRLTRTYAAKTIDDLRGITADLQPCPAPEPAVPPRKSTPERLLHTARTLPSVAVALIVLAVVSLTMRAVVDGYWFPWPFLILGFVLAKRHRRQNAHPGHRSHPYPAQLDPPNGYPPQAYRPYAYPRQAYPPQAYPPRAYPPHRYQAYPYPRQAYPPQSYPPPPPRRH